MGLLGRDSISDDKNILGELNRLEISAMKIRLYS